MIIFSEEESTRIKGVLVVRRAIHSTAADILGALNFLLKTTEVNGKQVADRRAFTSSTVALYNLLNQMLTGEYTGHF